MGMNSPKSGAPGTTDQSPAGRDPKKPGRAATFPPRTILTPIETPLVKTTAIRRVRRSRTPARQKRTDRGKSRRYCGIPDRAFALNPAIDRRLRHYPEIAGMKFSTRSWYLALGTTLVMKPRSA